MKKITSRDLVEAIYGPEKPTKVWVSNEAYCSPERPRFYERVPEGRVEPDNEQERNVSIERTIGKVRGR